MKRGQFVKCVECPDGEFTVGKIYEVLAGQGDNQNATPSGLPVQKDCFILTDDFDNSCYCIFPECCFGKWELV